MTTLSIILSDELAKASQLMAEELGVSRTEFIRQAIKHEIKQVRMKLEQQEMIKSMLAMKGDEECLKVAEEGLNDWLADLPEEEDEWWTKKK